MKEWLEPYERPRLPGVNGELDPTEDEIEQMELEAELDDMEDEDGY